MSRARIAVVVGALACLGALEWYAFVAGNRLTARHPAVKLGAGPFVGSWDLRLSPMIIPAIAIAIGAVVVLPRVADRLGPRRAIAATALVAIAFVVALAASDGWSAVIKPVIDKTEYFAGVAKARPASDYLRTFIDRQKFYSVHVRGHPPGFTLLLLFLRWLCLGSAWWAAGLSFAGVGFVVAGVGFVLHRLAGPIALRRSLPFLALAPYAVWQGTSADAFFAGVIAVGIALLVVAMTARRRRVEVASAVLAGLVLGSSCFLTFGAVTMLPLVVALAWRTKRIRWAIPAAAGFVAVFAIFAAFGYWWFDGLSNTRMFYAAGTAQFRPAFYFFFANLAVFVIAVGPAALAGLTRLTRGAVAVVVIGALACVVLADASGLSKAETERIWLLYMPWIAVAAGWLATTRRRQQLWLGAQATTAIVLQSILVSKW